MSDIDFDEMEFFPINNDTINSREDEKKLKWIIVTKNYGIFYPSFGFTNLGRFYLGLGNSLPKEDYNIQSAINYTDDNKVMGNVQITGQNYLINIEKDSYDLGVIQYESKKLKNNNSDIIIEYAGMEYQYLTQYNECTDFRFTTMYKDINIRDKNDNKVTTGVYNSNNYNIGHNGKSDHVLAGISAEFEQDNRNYFDDYNLFPKEGDRRHLNLTQYLDVDNSPNFTHLSGSYQKLFNIHQKNVLAIDLNYQHLLDNYPLFMALGLGGVNSVRGYYDSGLATAEKIFQGSIEYRFPIKDSNKLKLWGHIFVDYGTDLDSQKDVPYQIGTVLGKDGENGGYGLGIIGMGFRENKETGQIMPIMPTPIRIDLAKANGGKKWKWHIDNEYHELIKKN
ncbi:Surface antigen [seawater metagenome]|uniref:Surface antigen n=1 Tax=seawater metagenome TaxID=1561972 RepID=A0A5E8CJA8_9ZZZZ